jgi:uncharacterized phage protein gp47/JayE
MAIEVDSLSGLSTSLVEQTRDAAAELLQEYRPNVDVKRGVLFELLLHPQGIFQAQSQTNIARYKQARSLDAIMVDPTLADTGVVDEIASNYLLERLPGTKASGEIVVVVSLLQPVTFSAGTIFEADGQDFTITTAITAVTSTAEVQSPSDRVLSPLGNGNYTFSFPVTAVEEGEAGMIRKNALVVPEEQPLGYLTSYAESDFTGGRDAETNAQLMNRLLYGVAAKTFSGRVHMSAALRAETEFQSVIADSIIGFGDGEMLRDQHSIFPGSVGGRSDWYVRTQERVNNVGLTKTATLVEKTADGYGIWQFYLDRDDAPGFYDVSQIVLTTATGIAGSYEVTADVRGADLAALDNDEFLPDIDSDNYEAVYSRFQTAVIQFKDTDTDTADLVELSATQSYSVTVRAMPLIADVQDWASDRGTRHFGSDVLIKAPVPCFLEVFFTVQLKSGQTTPDLDTIKTALAQGVNRYGFTGRLPASLLSDIVHDSLEGVSHLTAVDILGRIRRPDGTTRQLRTTETLVIPDEPASMVSARTTAFILAVDDISISTEVVDIPEI